MNSKHLKKVSQDDVELTSEENKEKECGFEDNITEIILFIVKIMFILVLR